MNRNAPKDWQETRARNSRASAASGPATVYAGDAGCAWTLRTHGFAPLEYVERFMQIQDLTVTKMGHNKLKKFCSFVPLLFNLFLK